MKKKTVSVKKLKFSTEKVTRLEAPTLQQINGGGTMSVDAAGSSKCVTGACKQCVIW